MQAATWPRARGRVLGARAEGIPVAQYRGWPRASVPVVAYEYEVGGRVYRGHQVSFKGYTMRETVAAALRYRAGAVVDVAYDPAQPARAVLEPGADVRAGVYAALGGFVVCLSIAGLLDYL